LDNPVTVSLPGLQPNAFALLPDNETAVVVGGKPRDPNDREAPYVDSPPAGALVNLRTKEVRPFTNGHSVRIRDVACSANGSHIFTDSFGKDHFVRVWDVKAGKSLDPFPLPVEENASYHEIVTFPGSGKVAVATGDFVTVLGPTRDDKRFDLTDESFSHDWPWELAVSSDDKLLACGTGKERGIIWDVKSRKVVYATSLLPEGADYHDWSIHQLGFLKSGTQLIVARSGKADEVPEGKAEEGVAAEERGLFLIDVGKKRVTPLGMGHQIRTTSFALHPSEDWIVTTGLSRPDKPGQKDAPKRVSELRIYRFSTRSLVLRVQFGDDFMPSCPKFTSDGKKLVAIDGDIEEEGKVRSWDFIATKR